MGNRKCSPKGLRKTLDCSQCHIKFEVPPSRRVGKKTFCSKPCEAQYNRGVNNPNFGNRWTEEQKRIASDRVKKEMEDPDRRHQNGNGNRGVKFSRERVYNMHGNRDKESYVHYPDEKTRALIGKKSKEKFTPDYNKRMRKLFEERGIWTPNEEKADFEVYKQLSNWIDSMWKFMNEEDLSRLKVLGVFDSRKNKEGVVRDHILSRKNGYENRIFPEIIRHPANCQVLTNSQNTSKKYNSWLTIDQLFDKIETYDKEWQEHDIVLDLINHYKKGNRWKNPYK